MNTDSNNHIQLREERRKICNSCENKKTLVSLVDVCNLCKCPIFKKVKRENGCPIGKWK